MDVVYIVRPGDRNEELRYSLRSLANLPHDAVWAVGYRPRWAVVQTVQTQQRRGKYENSLLNIRAACEARDVSADFVYFNDDFMVLKPVDQLPIMHRGTVREFVAGHVRTYGRPGPYIRSLLATADFLKQRGIRDPLCFEGHVPIVFNRTRLRRALDLVADRPDIRHYRTLYGNLEGWTGEEIPDWKISGLQGVPGPRWPFASTADVAFERGAVGAWIRERFPERSPYERS